MFVRLTQANGLAVVVNTDQVKYIQDGGGNSTRLIFAKDDIVVVAEPIASVARALAGS